jgi:hypothetical protein
MPIARGTIARWYREDWIVSKIAKILERQGVTVTKDLASLTASRSTSAIGTIREKRGGRGLVSGACVVVPETTIVQVTSIKSVISKK